MTERLEQLNHRYEELSAQLSAPETYNDPALAARLNREQRELEPVVQAWRDLAASERELADAEALLHDEDEALRILAREEFPALKAAVERKRETLQILLLPRDPADEKNVIIEVRAGVGGEEAALFAHSLCRMYSMYADAKGWSVQMANMNQTELGGVKEAVFSISGQGAYSRLKYESGVHRVQRVPETESGGRIHTSTATVAVLPQVDEVEFELDMNEVRIDTFRSSGAGGQHINKTESAIRVTHIPTNTVVECQDERSQYKNKDRALSILRSRLYERARQEQERALSAQRRSQVGSGMRNERIRTYNFPQGRVTDHRIGLTLYQIDAVMDGALDTIIDALAAADRAEQMSSQREET
ncbi:MAG: peptide chain release factor 1 [Oscillospiraceae bacterium]|nr:peptide chain release factor 1 [Oscillospiraceae bacterium]